MCCSTSSRLLGWGVSVRTGPLSRVRLCVLLAGGGLGGRGAEQLGDSSLLFAGFPFDVLAQGVCLGLDVGLGRHGIALGAAAIKVTPYVVNWWNERVVSAWNDRALPAMQSRIRNLLRRKRRKQGTLQDETAETTDAPALPLTEADVACAAFVEQVDALSGEPGTPMSQAEAEEHLFAILIMAANIAERLRAFSGVRIESEDSERVELLSEAIQQLSTQRIADGINRLLESDTASLDEATVAQFMKLLKGARIPTQGYAPIRVEQLQEALRLEE